MILSRFIGLLNTTFRMTGHFNDPVFMSLLKRHNFKNYKKFIHVQKPYGKHVITKTKEYELSVLSWHAYGASDIHIHSKKGSWIKILEGELEETVYDDKIKPAEINKLSKGRIKHNKLMKCHKLCNNSEKLACSMHLEFLDDEKNK